MSLLLDALRRAEQAKRAKADGARGADDALEPAPRARSTAPASAAASASPRPRTDAPRVGTSARTGAAQEFSLEERDTPITPEPAAETRSPPSTSRNVAPDANREVARNVFASKEPLRASASAPSTTRRIALPLAITGVAVLAAALWFGLPYFKPQPGAGHVAATPTSVTTPPLVAAPANIATALPPATATTGQPGQAKSALPATVASASIPPLLPPPSNTLGSTGAPRTGAAMASASSAPPRLPTPMSENASERDLLLRNLNAPRGTRESSREPSVSLRLSSKLEAPTVPPAMTEAYELLRRGDYPEAQKRYAALAQTSPLNVDAHLGLATAAARSGDPALARRAYQRVLELDPRNETAIAGLLASAEGVAPDALIAELSKQVAANPGAAALHFALGNAYAADRRWAEAQQSYFEAYRLDGLSADYVYNLAVSLDQLGQSRLALEHYGKALQAATKHGAQFDRAAASRRIAELQAAKP